MQCTYICTVVMDIIEGFGKRGLVNSNESHAEAVWFGRQQTQDLLQILTSSHVAKLVASSKNNKKIIPR